MVSKLYSKGFYLFRKARTMANKKPLINPDDFPYKADGLITKMNCDFMEDPEFILAHTRGKKQWDIKQQLYWPFHVNQWAAFHAKQLEGDFVECGTNRGMVAMSNMVYIAFELLEDRKYYLFDTFCGLDQEFSSEEEYRQWKNAYPDCYDFVVNSFSRYPNVIIVKGSIPTTLAQVAIHKVAYLHIDMNCVLPEIEALEHFWPKLVTGAIVLLDDYGWPGHKNQKLAMDDFASSVGSKILSLPTGQGMLIKPAITASK